MLRPLLLFLCLWFCPGLVWAQDDFCGPVQSVTHACPMHSGQVCQCHEHELCYRIAQEKPSPKAPAPARFDFVCPPATEVVLISVAVIQCQRTIPPPGRLLCPCLAPEPPPPRA